MVSEQAKRLARKLAANEPADFRIESIGHHGSYSRGTYALARVLQEHSDVAKGMCVLLDKPNLDAAKGYAKTHLARFILPDDEPDVLEEIFAHQFGQNTVMREVSAKQLREGLDAAGFQIVRKDQ